MAGVFKRSPIRLEILRSKNGQFFARIVSSSSGRILFTSETYKRRQSALNAAEAVRKAVSWHGFGSHTVPAVVWKFPVFIKTTVAR